jgi:hypothetical protein
MELIRTGEGGDFLVGRVRDDFASYCTRCFDCCCLCTSYADVEVASHAAAGGFEKRFRLRVNPCCCGRVNNCCGATCFRHDAVFDILDAKSGEVVAHLQKTYAPGPGACCRVAFKFDNYVLEFPPSSTPEERALLLTAVFHTDYLHFEQRGGNNS